VKKCEDSKNKNRVVSLVFYICVVLFPILFIARPIEIAINSAAYVNIGLSEFVVLIFINRALYAAMVLYMIILWPKLYLNKATYIVLLITTIVILILFVSDIDRHIAYAFQMLIVYAVLSLFCFIQQKRLQK